MRYHLVLPALTLFCFSSYSLAQHQHHQQRVEEVFVDGQTISAVATQVNVSEQNTVDVAQALKLMPGADVNANGALTGIAQYRGMFGDRVAVSIDGSELLSGGPNAMDSPLSYASPLITRSLTLDRGISSISKAPESIGGHIEAQLDRGSFASSVGYKFDGFIADRYRSNGAQNSLASRLSYASQTQRFTVLGEQDKGDNIETPAGEISPSEMQRERLDASYAIQDQRTSALVYVGRVDTQDSGTPALAMDIRSIETDLAGVKYKTFLEDKFAIGVNASTNEVEHWMDNFSLRTPPAMAMQYRQNFATGEGETLSVFAEEKIDSTLWKAGVDTKSAKHNSIITNPTPGNESFEVINFNNVERELESIYLEIKKEVKTYHWELGVRRSEVTTIAGDVSSSMIGGPVALATEFNAADRELSFKNTDYVAKYGAATGKSSKVTIELGSKSRAPSYQELYLWLPLQATGGLADGRTYIGNLDLESERASEVTIGFDYTGEKLRFVPQIFYRKVSDFIQGTPSTNMTANMVSNMMSGADALQFNNVDAEFKGIDMAWSYIFSKSFLFEGVISVLESERTDEEDNLYRQTPDNARFAIHYASDVWHFTVETQLYEGQKDVAEYNNELTSTGYGLLNLRLEYDPTDSLNLELRLDNALDKSYQDHLAGVNRVAGAEIPQGERLYGAESSVSAGLKYRF